MSMTRARREKKKHWKAVKREGKLKLENELKPKIVKYLKDTINGLGTSPEDAFTLGWCNEKMAKLDKMTIAEMQEFCENYIN